MRRFVHQLVDRLRDPQARLSRNRNFSLFASPSGERALRVHRHLRSLEHDLARHRDEAELRVEERTGGVRLVVEIASLRLVRTALLSDDEVVLVADGDGPLAEALLPYVRRARPA